MPYALWLPEVLRAEGVTIVEESGWQTRGRGPMGEVRGLMNHHTAGPKDAVGTPSLKLIINGRGGKYPLAGPLSQLYLATDGTCHIVAGGRSNHAGEGVWEGVVTGNLSFIGMEMENAGDGTDDWPAVQYEAAVRINAGVLRHINAPAIMACGHKEYARPLGRKIDPAFPMEAFRRHVATVLENAPGGPAVSMAGDKVPAAPPSLAMLKYGSRGASVSQLQALLGITADGQFGLQTDKAVRTFQTSKGLVADGKVGPATWSALL